MTIKYNRNNPGEISNEHGTGYDGTIWLDYSPKAYDAWAIVEEGARLASIIQASPEHDNRVLSAEVNGLALALELLSGHAHAEEYPEAPGKVYEVSWREMIDAHAQDNYTNGRRNDDDLPWAEDEEPEGNAPTADQIEALDARQALDALGSEEYQASGEVFDALCEHIGRNVKAWHAEARAAGDTELAETLAEIAEDVFDTDLGAAEKFAAEINDWRSRPENARLDEIAETAAEDTNYDDSPWAAGVFEGIARAITAALAETADGNASDLKEAVYKAYGVAW